MNLNELTVRLLFLFLPGIVCSLVVAHLTTHRDLRPADHVIPSFLFGFLVYVLYSGTAAVWNGMLAFGDLPPYELIPGEGTPATGISALAILVSIVLATALAFVLSALKNRKVLNRIARVLRVTRKFGDRDVWSYMMNSDNLEWVVIRDRSKGLYYVGKPMVSSDEETVRELILTSTAVYDYESGEELYVAGNVYFSFPNEGLVIELNPKERKDEPQND
jgi:hypothetical protein